MRYLTLFIMISLLVYILVGETMGIACGAICTLYSLYSLFTLDERDKKADETARRKSEQFIKTHEAPPRDKL